MANVPTTFIDHIRSVQYYRNLIRQAEETLSSGKSLDKEQQEALRFKPIVEHQMDLIENLYNQLLNADLSIKEADETDPSASPADQPGVQPSESVGLSKEFRSSMDEHETREVANLDEPHSLDKPKFLCVSDGLVICCLEIKQSNQRYEDAASVPALPKASTLKMVGEGLPISEALFKLGSDAYLIGGQVIPEHPNPADLGAASIHWVWEVI